MRPLLYPTLWHAVGWLLLAVIAIAMAIPTPNMELAINHADKWTHVLVFATLAGWTAQLYPPSAALAWRGLGLLAFAAATELMQAMLPWRSGDWGDLIADACGVALGLMLAFGKGGRALLHAERVLKR